MPAPWFRLNTLDGGAITSTQLRGKVTVFVIGRTRPSAPPCREWSHALFKQFERTRVEVFQVVVADKPWYLPRRAVISQIRKFAPAGTHHRVLLEWYTFFADQFDVVRDDLPTIIVIDKQGVIRYRTKGHLKPPALAQVESVIRAQERR